MNSPLAGGGVAPVGETEVFFSAFLDRVLAVRGGFFFATDRSSNPATAKATATILLKKSFSSPPTALPETPETHKQLDEKKYVFEVSMYLFLSWVDPRAPQEVSKATNETTAEGGRDCARALSFSFF